MNYTFQTSHGVCFTIYFPKLSGMVGWNSYSFNKGKNKTEGKTGN